MTSPLHGQCHNLGVVHECQCEPRYACALCDVLSDDVITAVNVDYYSTSVSQEKNEEKKTKKRKRRKKRRRKEKKKRRKKKEKDSLWRHER